MATYGVNLVTQHHRWDNFLQQLRGKATFEVCAAGICKEIIVPFTALDIIEWGTKIASWASGIGKDLKIPLLNGLTVVGESYTPVFTGEMPRDAILFVPDGEPVLPPAYSYIPASPMDDIVIGP